MTCPECRHVVDVPPGKTLKCHNCRTRITAPLDEDDADARPTPAAPLAAATAPPITPPTSEDQITAVEQRSIIHPIDESAPGAAAIATFVFGLLFFIPLVTQVIALVIGCIALVNRKPAQRMRLVWVGMLLAALAMIGWLGLFGFARTNFVGRFGMTVQPYAQPGTPSDWEHTDRTALTMERIQRATLAYHRDFGSWPDGVDSLVGHRLPVGFALAEHIHYRAVPPAWKERLDWVLIVSDDLDVDREGEALAAPHRLVARLDGSLDLLPTEEVAAILEGQPAE